MTHISGPTELKKTVIPIRDEVMSVAKSLYNNNFYLTKAEIVVNATPDSLPYILGNFDVWASGHYSFSPGHVHVPDSMASIAQLGYVFFMQSSLDGLIPGFPKVTIERLSEIARDKTGGAFWKSIGEADFKALPLKFGGRMNINRINSHHPEGLVVDTNVRFGRQDLNGVGYSEADFSKHIFNDARFIVKL